MPYRTLSADAIIRTQKRLCDRISERFPERGLALVARELLAVGEKNREHADKVRRPYFILRAILFALLVLGVAAQVYLVRYVKVPNVAEMIAANGDGTAALALFESLEAAINILILMGAALFFLVTLEERMKRRKILDDLHELRSIAHVVDMHQLTKDPTRILDGQRTKSSPEREMSEFELTRYLDYCAEMLSLAGKMAALYAQNMRDPVVIQAVNEIEDLTTNLSRKIWQKIMIIHQLPRPPELAPAPASGPGAVPASG
jgi:hypothetical protein